MTARTEAFRGRTWLIALILWLALATVAALALWHLRSDTVKGQMRELGLLSLALTDEIDRGLQGAEEGLKALRAELRDGRLPLIDGDIVASLQTRANLMPLVRTLWLVDDDGRVIAASDPISPPAASSFEPALGALDIDGMAIGRPFVDEVRRETAVALAVRLVDTQGRPRGWILAAMPARLLLGAFDAAIPAADARMAVFRGDGARLAGVNADAPRRAEAAIAQRLAESPAMEVRRFADGSDNLVGLHDVPRYGLKVLVSRDVAAVLASWRQAAEFAVVALLVLLGVIGAAARGVQLADRRRDEAQRALQAQLARTGKLESLGTLAGGVAHDFNNVLAGILGYAEMAHDAAEPGGDQERHLDKVLKAALRGKALVERILAFSRGGARVSTVFELQPVVEEVLALLAGTLRPGIVLERALEAQGAGVRGDPTQAFEAVMNLCTNAIQAMPAGGMLSIRLQRIQVNAPKVLSHSALSPGRYLSLTVSDQGEGITAAVMEHLFEPFFTTRAAQSGTGLGLAVVHGVVAEFGGAIDVQSVPGRGARFTLYFPESAAAAGPPVPSREPLPAGSGQALLVVDDEPMLVSLAEEMLRGLGYQPAGFSDPQAALEAWRDGRGRFAAVITDEVMPGLTGTQLAQAIRSQEASLPVLLVSGYGGASLAQRAAEAGVTRVLGKPLQRAELAQALADVLR
jgi:signal transduction histidine kinase